MKPRSHRFLPDTLVVCGLACASAQGTIINFNEQNVGNNWTLPAGANLLSTATAAPGTATSHEGSSTSWATLFDGQVGTAGDKAASVTPEDTQSVTFALDLASAPAGHTITSFDSYCAWPDSGRDNQNYTLQYSTVANPTTFITIATVANASGNPVNSTHTSITDTTGIVATGVHSIRLNFAGQENGWTGFRELVLRSAASPVVHLNESNSTNVWTLPAGTNLLNGTTANSPSSPAGANHGNGDVTSGNWSTLTNGTVGAPGAQLESVAPGNGTSVIFPLDTSVNVNGYNISSFDSYCAWPNSGRDNQDFAIRYSTVSAPTVFIPLAEIDNNTSSDNATHTRLTRPSGYLATNVAAVQFYFNNQENGYVGYREFVAIGTAVSLSDPLTWTGNSGAAGNADWADAVDNNWKKTADNSPANFNLLAPVTFDATGANRNITLPSGVTSASVSINNNGASAYTFGGEVLTITNDLVSSGSGNATFANEVSATTGVTQSGSGNLVFNGPLISAGLTLSGTGGIALNTANSGLMGTLSVSNGTLTVADDLAVEEASLAMTGGTAVFTSSSPVVASLSGTAGSIVLGKTVGSVNTTLGIGDSNDVTTTFAGGIGNAPGVVGSLSKLGASSLVLSGTNTYTGPTSVNSGSLEFGKLVSLYGGITGSWTASNLFVDEGATLGFKAGGAGEFAEADLALVSLDGFQPGSFLGIDATANVTLSRNLTRAGVGLVKTGPAVLSLTGNNTSTGLTTISSGALNAASLTGTSIPGNLQMGDNTSHVVLNMGANNQFGANSVITMSAGAGFFQGKINLRSTAQTVAGLQSAGQFVSLIQNDESDQVGYPGVPGPASITINAAADHSFQGIIRDAGANVVGAGAVSLIKNGPGTQELITTGAQGYGYTGPTTINQGKLKLNFTSVHTGFASNIEVGAGGSLQFHTPAVNVFFDRVVSGTGPVLVTGTSPFILRNGNNSNSGGITVDGGFLALDPTLGAAAAPGAGNAPGQTCTAGAMTPSNLLNVINGSILSLDHTAAFGQSTMVPAFASSVRIGEGCKLSGGLDSVVFVPNLTLDGATVEIHDGAGSGGFNTNICFVGTVVVGGSSSIPTTVNTTGVGANANASLGSAAAPGTTFQVADVTGNGNPDLTINSLLKDVANTPTPSPLTKTGPGTMALIGGKAYTGATTVTQGELRLDTAYLADTAGVTIASAGVLNLLFSETDTVATLTLDGVQAAAGTYGSPSNVTPGVIHTPRIKGDGLLLVTSGPGGGDPYTAWASVITDPADRDKTDDPDADGFTNLQEYLLGGSPTVSNGTLTTVERSGNNLIVRWAQRNSGGVYTLQEGTTLANPWGTSAAPIGNAADQSNLYSADYTRKEATVPIDSSRKFVRVHAVTTP